MPKIDLQEIQARLDQGLPPAREPQPSASNYDNPNHPIWELWQRMGEIYGHQWASQQGDEPNDTWARGLEGLTAVQYGIGLRALLDRAERWPPNLVEFRQLCTGFDAGGWERQCHKPASDALALESRPHLTDAAQQAGQDFFGAMREVFTNEQ